MKLEENKKYVLRSGQVVGPLFKDGPIFMSFDIVDRFMPMWTEDGKADFFSNPEDNYPEHDIVKEFDKSKQTV